MILGLLGQFFEPVKIEIFLKFLEPISQSKMTYFGSKMTYFGSKIEIFGPILHNKWKISRKHNQKWMIPGLLGQFSEPVEIEIVLKFLDPTLGNYLVGPRGSSV